MTRTLLLFGAGPGIGNHVARAFASDAGIEHVVLLARDQSRLTNEDAPFVQNAAPGVKISTLRVDLSNLDALPGVLKELDDLIQGEDVEVVYYNAARIKPTMPVLDVGVGEIEEDFKVQVLALHIITQHYLPRLTNLASSGSLKPALLVTSSHLPWDPVPPLLSLSLVKGAQRTQVLALNREFGQKGVLCGLVSVQGVVDPGNKVLSPKSIAGEAVEYWRKGVDGGAEINLVEPGA